MEFNTKRTILVGFAFFTVCVFWGIYNSVIPLMLKFTYDLNEGVAGVIMGFDNMLAVVLLPVFGALSDRTNTRIGKRMPYIIFGTIAAVISMILLVVFNEPDKLTQFMITLGVLLLAMSIYRSPSVALMPDLTPKTLLSKGNAIINLMGTLGGIIALAFIPFLSPQDDGSYMPLFLSTAVIMILGVSVLFFTIRENKYRKEREDIDRSIQMSLYDKEIPPKAMSSSKRKSLILILASIFLWYFGYNAIISAYSKYAVVRWDLDDGMYAYILMIAQGAALFAYIPIGIIATNIGRKKSILIGIAMVAISFALIGLFIQYSVLIVVLFIIAGIGWAAINVNSYPMVVALSKGNDIGKYTGYYYTASMASQIVTPIVSGLLLEYVGYWTLFPYSALFVALSAITMIYVKHGDERPIKTKDVLEAFDTED